jgi:hypothetical protein
MLQSTQSSSEWYKIMPLTWYNVRAAGSMTLVSKTILIHLEPDSPEVMIHKFYMELYISINYLQLHTQIKHSNLTNIQYSRYQNGHEYLQAVCYRCHPMQDPFARHLPVQQLLRWVQYASYLSGWQPGWTNPRTKPNNESIETLLESPQPILELEDVIPIVESFCTSYKWSILFSPQADAPDIGGSDLVDYN